MSELDQLYQQVIIDHSRAKNGYGELEDSDGESFQVNPSCGDEVTLYVRLGDEGEISAVGWTGQGCSISQASLSVMNDLVVKQKLGHVRELEEKFLELMHNRGKELSEEDADMLEDANAFSGVAQFPARIKCALLGWMALRDALAQAQSAKEI